MIRLTCREVIARLADYVDAALGVLMHARVAVHLALCGPCRAYLATYKRTRALVSRSGQVEMPGEARHRVTRALVERLRRGR
ncbi:MAG TPA: zf-HC2 domain-containing protein [Candidatus Binatia bacterium]|nr:zf-HC2 domain-containing protein [Candidatus Binatia bacterium]